MGVAVDIVKVKREAQKIGCLTFEAQLSYLGINVGVAQIKKQGIDMLCYFKKKIGNGVDTLFYEDVWRGGVAFKTLYPRVYALESCNNIFVALKLSQDNVGSSLRRILRGGAEQAQFSKMCANVEGILLPVMRDKLVSTACYVLDRALVTKSHNKTPYELLNGRTPRLDFMRPFGCPLTILNTLDPLGKFKGKADEGFLVGYSITSKAFRSSDAKAADDKPKDDTCLKTVEEPVNKEDQAYIDKLDRLMSQEKEANSQIPNLEDTAELRSTGIFNSAYDDDLYIFTSPVQSMGVETDFNNMESSTINSMNSEEPNLSTRPTQVEVPKELPKVSMVNSSLKKLKHHLASFDVVVKERTTATAITEGTWEFEHTKASLKDTLRKLKGKAIVDEAVILHPIDPELLKIDVAPLAPKLQNHRTTHYDYLKHTQEETVTLREIFEHKRSLNLLNTSLDYASGVESPNSVKRPKYKDTKLKNRVLKKNDDKRPSAHAWKMSSSVSIDSNKCETMNLNVIQLVLWIVDSEWLKHMTGNLQLLRNFVEKFMGTVRFENDYFSAITGYGDYVQGILTIYHVYYVEGLVNNLFLIKHFCDGD
uniref:Ribonuclease H-like domain-containing protein n=1 Tax=Tanacetum cinerariifolium TaxID=118510 RepID=A0A6L2KC22_TANCI|nr:ribonuclease H-like domain-containing protein [Tanacetum cinerariifolium]